MTPQDEQKLKEIRFILSKVSSRTVLHKAANDLLQLFDEQEVEKKKADGLLKRMFCDVDDRALAEELYPEVYKYLYSKNLISRSTQIIQP